MFLTEEKTRNLLQKLPHGICIYRGSPNARHLAPQIIAFLKKALDEGENLRFRNINELYSAFDEKRCVYAINLSNEIVGFYYFNVKEAVRNCVILSSLVVAASFRGKGIGGQLRAAILELIRESYPNHDIISFTANPVVKHWNQRIGYREVTYRELWEIYGLDVIKDCANHPNVSCELKPPFDQSNIFEDVEIFHAHTRCLLKGVVLNLKS